MARVLADGRHAGSERRMLMRALLAVLALLTVLCAPAAASPVAALSGPATVNAGQRATFDATSSKADAGREIVEYAWDLDANGTFEEIRRGPRITIIPEVAGPQELAVRVTDDTGATSVAVGHYLVIGKPPVARIAAPDTVVTGQPVTLDGSGSSSTSGSIDGWQWDLDGSGWGPVRERPTMTTTFTRPGTYTVALRVRDSALGYGTVRREIVVTGPASSGPPGPGPAAPAGGDPALGIAPLDSVAQTWLTGRRFAALGGAPRRRLASARRGLWVNLVSDRPARFALGVHVRKPPARRLKLRGPAEVAGHVRIARARHRLAVGGQKPFRIVLAGPVRRKLTAPVRLVVRGFAIDADGTRTPVSRAFSLIR